MVFFLLWLAIGCFSILDLHIAYCYPLTAFSEYNPVAVTILEMVEWQFWPFAAIKMLGTILALGLLFQIRCCWPRIGQAVAAGVLIVYGGLMVFMFLG